MKCLGGGGFAQKLSQQFQNKQQRLSSPNSHPTTSCSFWCLFRGLIKSRGNSSFSLGIWCHSLDILLIQWHFRRMEISPGHPGQAGSIPPCLCQRHRQQLEKGSIINFSLKDKVSPQRQSFAGTFLRKLARKN